jgi:hypothetical protein
MQYWSILGLIYASPTNEKGDNDVH